METKFDETIFKNKIDQDVKNMALMNSMFTKISNSENSKKLNFYKIFKIYI
jgi:hypothetical protein